LLTGLKHLTILVLLSCPVRPWLVNRRIILAVVLLAWIAFIVDLALFRFPAANPVPNFAPFRSIAADLRLGGQQFFVNLLGNIVAFVPMGALPPLIRKRRTALWHVVVFCLALSLSIEIAQFFSGRRVPDVDDLILNALGGAIGYALAARRLDKSVQNIEKKGP
jgi:glycopeptide antibiotics resistance protein